MENANILLDRYGLPYIPGSAVKGCARRMALQALHDWIAAGTPRPATGDACAPCCEGFANPAGMLASIAHIFGWVETDWASGKEGGVFHSDFGWACGEGYEAIWRQACELLARDFGWKFSDEKPWKGLPNFGGTIAFLEAKPNNDPGLELDVLTPHHTRYYQGDPNTATDTENPVPVYFPAIKPQQRDADYFTFPLIPLHRAVEGDLAIAKSWLANGLELFGLGAKTAAGYGWFDASERLQETVKTCRENEQKRISQEAEWKIEEEKKAREAEIRRQKKEAEAKALEGLSPEQQEDTKLELLNEGQFDNKLRNFWKEPRKGGPLEPEKAAIVRALKGSRIEIWKQFKTKATKGDLARVISDIHALNKKLHGDKMP